MKSTYYRVFAVCLSVLFSVAVGSALVSAATTISTNIQTDGTLNVTGTSALLGNVGIGTTTPQSNLAISSPGTTALTLNTDATSGDIFAEINFAVAGEVKNYIWQEYDVPTVGYAPNDIAIGDGAGSTAFRVGTHGDVVINGGTDYQPGWSMPDPYPQPDGFYDASSTNALTIGSFGHTRSTFNIYSTDSLGNPLFIVRDDGNVGIGTSTPATRLQVSNGASATTTVTVGELGLTSSKACVNMNAADGSASSFYINAAHTLVVEANYCR